MTLLLWDNALANSKLNIASYTRYFDFVSMTFSSKGTVNPFELSPAESRFPFTKPFTRVSVVEHLIFQCEPESMITCIVIANEEIRRDSSKFKVLYKQSSDTGQQNV